MDNQFTGFSTDMIDFLFELQFTNTIENQGENIVKYKELISKPLRLLYEDLLHTVVDLQLDVETKPARCVSSPYTDRRFSKSTPLKEFMYIRYKKRDKETDTCGLYFDMGVDSFSYGIRMYWQTTQGVNLLREKILEKPDEYSSLLDEAFADGFEVFGDKYNKDHYPSLPECSAKEILNRRRFFIGKSKPINENVFSQALAVELSKGFIKLRSLFILLED